jgi:LmbE family N-acetylglucosaminyl deacetylase
MRVHDERPSRLLVIGARPGDADRALAGSVARWVAEGCVAHLVCCTSGDASADDAAADPLEVAAHREREQRAAAARVGYEAVTFLHQPEGALADSLAVRELLVRIIRGFRPEAVAAPDPRDLIRMDGTLVSSDVRAAGGAAIAALTASDQAMAFPHIALAEGLARHRVARLYLYWSDRSSSVIDIGASLEVKVAALVEHSGHPRGSARLVERARAEAATVGSSVGLSAAEACAIVDLPP